MLNAKGKSNREEGGAFVLFVGKGTGYVGL